MSALGRIEQKHAICDIETGCGEDVGPCLVVKESRGRCAGALWSTTQAIVQCTGTKAFFTIILWSCTIIDYVRAPDGVVLGGQLLSRGPHWCVNNFKITRPGRVQHLDEIGNEDALQSTGTVRRRSLSIERRQ
ncbi:hypothetical protein Slin15195_G114230 [Septoria linicola]|uniref:Uncharacterized protein n=1 Tax=Septoria linicola TaxID=215465 RepID=A0A9Q9AZK1_9PEZI|nr:hypothetical protein Slin14017_G112530 [Septoria linicola]USW58104.1 hypothetical protein Slin15195_G114230 [Septoria linicola]